jgi:hypothetical protein
MSEYNWLLSTGAPLCLISDSFYRTVRDTIFQQLTTDTTKEQWQAALEHLQRLRDEWARDIYPMHYGALVGRHRCVEQLFQEARARLRSLEIMQPQPPPQAPAEPAPAPEPKPRSLRDVLQDLAGMTDTDTPEGE